MPGPGSLRATISPEVRREAATDAAEDETELVARAKRDRAAFAPLYVRYFDRVYRYCYRRLGNQDAAAEATSQVFAKALAALPGCRAASFRSWLFAIAHNVVADEYRSRRPDQSLEAAADLPDAGPSPEDLALAAEERRSLQALLARLPPDQRRVVELRLVGLTGHEIGRVLGRSRSAVDAAQFRAVVRLRALLGVGVRSKEARDAER